MKKAGKNFIVYVYYKIPAQEYAHYFLAIKELSQAIKKDYPLLETNQQKRQDVDAENKELWMETYQGVLPDEFEKFKTDLALLAEKKGLPKERKYEVFVSL